MSSNSVTDLFSRNSDRFFAIIKHKEVFAPERLRSTCIYYNVPL
jgi:hypothetical protein